MVGAHADHQRLDRSSIGELLLQCGDYSRIGRDGSVERAGEGGQHRLQFARRGAPELVRSPPGDRARHSRQARRALGKAYLRIDGTDEDALIATLAGAAMGLCERFTGLALFSAARSDVVPASSPEWQRLPATPVSAIASVATLDPAGVVTVLDISAYAIDIDASGDGWVRLAAPVAASRLLVGYTAGAAADWPSLADPLRQGVLRLVAHLYTHRDAADEPPAAVAALWRPYRRMRLA